MLAVTQQGVISQAGQSQPLSAIKSVSLAQDQIHHRYPRRQADIRTDSAPASSAGETVFPGRLHMRMASAPRAPVFLLAPGIAVIWGDKSVKILPVRYIFPVAE